MSSTTTSSVPLVLYDISSKPPVEQTCFSPNPWKSRFALNFKGLVYTTSWTALPDIPKTRAALKLSAGRKFADGSDFFTLPILVDATTDSVVGDSFDIAVYLQKTYPESGAGDLFPDQELDFNPVASEILVPLSKLGTTLHPNYIKFNTNVDMAFTRHVQLATLNLPFDPASAEATKAEFVRRASPYGVTSWDAFTMTKDMRQTTMESLKSTLEDLAVLFRKNGGPFLLGFKANYADLIVGAWLQMFSRTLPEDEWEQIKTWHDGIFGRLHEALQEYAVVR